MENSSRQENERLIWDKIAKSYDRNVMKTYETAYRRTIEAILEEVDSSSKVLEVGCGTGIIAMAVAPEVKEITGVDISPKMIAQAQKKIRKSSLDNITFQVEDGYHLSFADSTFDVVLLTNLLHIVADPAAILKEAHRLLNPGGLLVTVTDCLAERVPLKIRLNLMELRLLKLLGRVKFIRFFRKSDLKALLNDHGFNIEKEAEFHPAPVNYYLTGKRL